MSDRLQVKLNGRRFEFDRQLAIANCAFFQQWYSQAQPQLQQQLTEINGVKFEFSQAEQELRVAASEEQQHPKVMLDVFSFSGLPSVMPDWFGLIQVALRKERLPALNWGELQYAEQEGVAWLVNTFGITKFQPMFGTPSATEESYRKALEEASVPPAAASALRESSGAGGLPTLQQWLVDRIRKEVERRGAEAAASAAAAPTGAGAGEEGAAAANKAEPAAESAEKAPHSTAKRAAADSSDDENLMLSGVGCYFCGVATHAQKDCPNAPKQPNA